MESASQFTTQISSRTLNFEFGAQQMTSDHPKVLRISPVDSGAGLIEVDMSPFTFGRDPKSSVVVSEDSASRMHAKLERRDDHWHIVDLGSTNGTWVNGTRVETQKLRGGDSFRVGRWAYKFFDQHDAEAKYHESVYEMMTQDELTGAWNKRYLNDILRREVSQHKRTGMPICLLMIDIDYFKTINDENGHHVGDEVLRDFGRRVRESIRDSDVFCRFGGDEFAVMMVNTGRADASVVANRILKAVVETPFETSVGQLAVTISSGFAECSIENSISYDALMELADEQLYQAKQAGRCRVVG